MFDPLKKLFTPRPHGVHDRLEQLAKRTPIPVFWLVGKTQSGKTSLIKYLTGADDAEIGTGFKPCTRHSREYHFPSWEAPLLIFIDTRGLEEPGYDAAEDIARFDAQAHVVVVTARVLDFALEKVLEMTRTLVQRRRNRPVVVALTCLHDAYPQAQHVEPYPFLANGETASGAAVPEALARAVTEQRRQFEGLGDYLVPVDLTPAEEGFQDPAYGGPQLKNALIQALPEAYRQSLLKLEETTGSLRDYYERRALPHILAFSGLAATAGAMPVPWLDLLVLPGLQTQMVFHLARLYGQTLSREHFAELASALGLGMIVRQGIREFAKLIPVFGSVASAALAGAATFALGKACCYYYSAIRHGHVPSADELKRYYQEQLARATTLWKAKS